MSRELLGQSPVMEELKQLIRQVAGSKANILILGESGTGKELVARMIHDLSLVKGKPFIPVNCGAIPETLIETELFGHHKGSFTGAVSDKMGLFEAANGGTLFLDEVGELPLSMQVKLLRVIQERVFRKVGGVQDIQVDVRIIGATNLDLEAEVRKGRFREDLYYRLNVILIRTPPLRDRRADILLLAQRFLESFSRRANKTISDFEPSAAAALEAYPWPGNVRELENVLERAVMLEGGSHVSFGSLPLQVQKAQMDRELEKGDPQGEIRLPFPDFSQGNLDLDRILGEAEKVYLLAALKNGGGLKKKAADLLGITFRSLRNRIKKLNLTGFSEDG